jgi:hypothetical protein
VLLKCRRIANHAASLDTPIDPRVLRHGSCSCGTNGTVQARTPIARKSPFK